MKIENAFRAGLIGTLGVGLGLMLIQAVGSLATILTYIGCALFLALGLDPAVKLLEKKKFPKWAAVTTVVVGTLALFVMAFWAVVPVIIEQSISFLKTVPEAINKLKYQDWVTFIDDRFGTTIDTDAMINTAAQFFADPKNIGQIAGGALAVGVGIANGISGAIIVLILTLYFTAGLQTVKKTAYSLVPKSKRDQFMMISEQITGGVGKYVMGQIFLAMLNGFLAFVVLSIIGAKGAVTFGFVAFLFALIPLIGTVMSAVIVTTGQLILAGPETAIIIGIYFLIYMQIEAYVLSPRVMNKAVSIPGSVVVIAAMAGGTLLGVLGALIAIPIAASIVLIIKEVVVPAQEDL